ncbi:MAG: GldG family protein [Bacteroidota bacterium]|jgi:gliding-associated putative ABC transporter substrate-binding component GldG
MNTKKTQTLLRVLLVLGILILVNFISVRIFGRLDLTKAGVYTLSDASKNLVSNLDDRVTVKAYFTEDLPAPYNNNRRAVLDILNDYKSYSKGNLHYEFINPEGEKNEREAQQAGIPPVEVQIVKEDKFEVKRAFLGLVMMYEDKKEVLPVIQNLGSLEYDISAAIKRLTARTKKRIGYTTGHQETALTSMQHASQEINAQYETVPVDLSSNTAEIPQDLAALLIIAPQTKFSDTAKYQIDQYLMRGGKLAFLLNKMNVDLNAQYKVARSMDLGLEDMLENYGIRINGDLVRDAQCASITVMQNQGQFQMRSQIPFPYLPNAVNVDRSNPIVKDLQGIIFFFVSSLDTTLAANKGLKAEVLVRSSKHSGRQSGFVMIDPFHRYTPEELAESNIPMAAVVSGSFKSFFEGKSLVPHTTKSPDTRIIVVGDGDFMKDDFAGNRSNLTFFVNIVDFLADDAGLITIRSKDIDQPPLEQVSDGTKKLLKYGALLLPPFLVIGYGLLRWRRRIALKRSLESQL